MTLSDVRPRVAVVITAAGSGSRLGYGAPKALVPLRFNGTIGDDSSLFSVALRNVMGVVGIARVVITAPLEFVEQFESQVRALALPVPVDVVAGSVSRQSSVFAGLKFLAAAGFGSEPGDVVLVHDAARAMAGSSLMNRLVAAVTQGSDAVIPTLAVSDTLKAIDPEAVPDSVTGKQQIVGSVDRSSLRAVQTPQAFPWQVLFSAHKAFASAGENESTAATDDSTITQWAGHEVDSVEGDTLAMKVTTPTDLALARVLFETSNNATDSEGK